MSADPQYSLKVIPPGQGLVLDLAGGGGMLRQSLETFGYHYVNAEIERYRSENRLSSALLIPYHFKL
jgi:hypothetical protein